MSVNPSGSLEGYATTKDVADFFDQFDDFDSSTSPPASQVKRRIQAESDWVDRYTGHAWRPRRIDDEYLTIQNTYYWLSGSPLKLQKRQIITPLDNSEGDYLEVWIGDGSQQASNDGYNDWVQDPAFEEGRDGDYWIEEPTGMLYIYRRKLWFRRHKEIRVSYRYGREWPDAADNDTQMPDEEYVRQNVPQAIRDAVAKRVAAYYLETQQYRITTPGNQEAPNPSNIAQRWREQVEMDLRPYKEVRNVGSQ